MTDHPDRPVFDPGAGAAPAEPPPAAGGQPTAPLPTAPWPAPAPVPPVVPPVFPPRPPAPSAGQHQGYPPPAPYAPYQAPIPYAASAPSGPVPSSPSSPSGSAGRSRVGWMVAVAAVVGLLTGLLGGGLGSLLTNRVVAGARAGSPVPAPLPGATTRPDGSIAKIAATALPSVVTVKIRTADGSGNGSGFVIDRQGHVLTNNHVVSGATGAGEISVELIDGTSLPATIVGRDASYDLAVLLVDRTDLTPLEWGRSADVVVGDGVIAVGAPLGLEATVTSGIVSALNRPVAAGGGDETSFINAIQTDAAINPGNSGGPLIDANGNVIGVNSQIATGSGSSTSGNVGIGFAIPSNTVKDVVGQLIEDGKAEHAYLGISGATINEQLANALNLGTDTGVLVQEAPKDGPAAQAGIKAGDTAVTIQGQRVMAGGDVITKVNGTDLGSMEDLIDAVNGAKVGDEMELEVQRDGQTSTVTVKLGTRPDDTQPSK